jgi:hypothetical protein
MSELEKHLAGKPARLERDTDAMATLLAKALGGADRFDVAVMDWPGRPEVKIGLRLLSDFDIAESDAGARAWATAKALEVGKQRFDDREFTARYGAELVSRALVNPESKQRMVETATELSKLVTRDELDALALAVQDHQESLAPTPYMLTDAELDRLAEAVKRPDPFRARALSTCAPSTLRRLAALQAVQLVKLAGSPSLPLTAPTGTTSAG